MTDKQAIEQLSRIIASQGEVVAYQSKDSCRALFHAINALQKREDNENGQWLFHRCSKCGTGFDKNINLDKYIYCPNCGTKMIGNDNE